MPLTISQKILAIQFQYLGDAVFITPALFAIKTQFPQAELHVLVAKEVAPLFENIPWIKKVWGMPRSRGKFKLDETWPFIKALRKEKFERSVAFGCNDRAALTSLLVGAKIRLGPSDSNLKLLPKIAFTDNIDNKLLPKPYVAMYLKLLSLGWNIPIPSSPQLKIISDASLAKTAKTLLPPHSILCHLGTSQIKKEWPVNRWKELYELATKEGYKLIFSAGPSKREQALIVDLKRQDPSITVLPPVNDLSLFLSILNQAEVVIAGDTGPLQFAAGLGVKIIGLLGVENSILQTAPNYQKNQLVQAKTCSCVGELANHQTCQNQNSCMNTILPSDVLSLLLTITPPTFSKQIT